MNRRMYIYQKQMSKEIIDLFRVLGSAFSVLDVTDDVLTVLDTDYYNPEPFDMETFRELIISDFNKDITMFIEPYSEEDFYLSESIKEFLKSIAYGVYYFEDIITFAVIKNNLDLKKEIINYMNDKTSNEVVHTVREFISNNMNSSKTSKELFMHRNTLNYRIDNFILNTKINVKTFKGANAVYLLYNY